MYSLTATKIIRQWIAKELKTYRLDMSFSHKYIKVIYQHPKFIIKEYISGIITIDGEYQQRIYRKLVEISGEDNCLGCDEVGVGDFFGPVVYCSVLFDKETMENLKNSFAPIKDSKKLKDAEILKMYEELKNKVNHNIQIMYDSQIGSLNSIGQKVYNHYQNIKSYEDDETSEIVIDLFTTEKSFYKYSNDLDIEWPDNIVLETKADGKYLCVALASIFARAVFLSEMKKLEEKYQMKFPLGATNVKQVGRDFISKYSREELKTFAKTSFKTFNEL